MSTTTHGYVDQAVGTFALRDALVVYLEGAISDAPANFPAGVKVYNEQPDALVPPAYVVAWDGLTPASDAWGLWATALAIECWPATDLAGSAYALSRDQLLAGALGALAGGWQPAEAAVSGFAAALETAQLGQQPTRIAVVRAQVHHAAPC